MSHVTGALPRYIPSPPISSFHVGPLDIRFYALGYIIGITLAVLMTRRRWRALGGDLDLVGDIALWVVPAGIIGGRIYFDITTPADIPHVWYGVFAVWTGGLGIWGGVALAAAVGVWRLRRHGITPGAFANAVAPGLLVAQAIGRIGNYFNKELFGGPTTLPWGLEIPYASGSGSVPGVSASRSTARARASSAGAATASARRCRAGSVDRARWSTAALVACHASTASRPASVAVSSTARRSPAAAARHSIPRALSAFTMVVTVLGRMFSSRASWPGRAPGCSASAASSSSWATASVLPGSATRAPRRRARRSRAIPSARPSAWT